MSLVIGPLNEAELDDADSIFRLSFARFYGLADPAQMFGDIDYVRTRWRTAPNAAFGAFLVTIRKRGVTPVKSRT
jgi:hypothetical protein